MGLGKMFEILAFLIIMFVALSTTFLIIIGVMMGYLTFKAIRRQYAQNRRD